MSLYALYFHGFKNDFSFLSRATRILNNSPLLVIRAVVITSNSYNFTVSLLSYDCIAVLITRVVENRIHERVLSLVYSDHVTFFDQLLKTDGSLLFTTGTFKVQLLKFKIFFHGLSSSFMRNVFHLNTNIPYNLRPRSERYRRNPRTVKYGAETISYLAPKMWSLVHNVIKKQKVVRCF